MDVMKRLRDDFMRADYRTDAVLNAIGQQGQMALTRNHTMAASRALAGRGDGLATLIRLFVLQQWQPTEPVARTVDAASLADLGLLTQEGSGFRASVDVRPFADDTDGTSGWVVSDHTATLDTRDLAPAPDLVLGISPASISLSQITPRKSVGRALDLGTGSGVQSVHVARRARQVVATDVNPRALTLANLTFALNAIKVETRLGSLYDPVQSETFDLITSNPPFVISPGTGPRLVYREAGQSSDDLMRDIITGAGPHLTDGGSLHIVGNWAHVRGSSWSERVAAWIPRGCDGFFVERETLDPYEYIEIWLADAGLAGKPDYAARYSEWLDYFDQLNIEGVGMGWVTMVKSGSASPRVICESWPHPVRQPVAQDLMAHLRAMDVQSWSDTQIMDLPWVLAPGCMQETASVPGHENPTQVVLRRGDGLMRAVEVDPALGGVLGACDGELLLGRIIAAVAQLMQADLRALTDDVMPHIRHLISQTWLTPSGGTGVR